MLMACGFAIVAAQPAQAGYSSWVSATTWAYTDSRDPDGVHVGQADGLPVGTWLDEDGKHHKSRAYVTFDLRPYAGKQIISATGVAKELAVNDCDTARDWELWLTAPISSTTTWRTPPAELSRLGDFPGSPACPANYSEVVLTDAFRQALAAGRESITLEVRVPEDREGNPHLGRRIAPLNVALTANATPGTPVDLSVDAQSCASPDPIWVSNTQPTLRAALTDPDSAPPGDAEDLTATFAIWPTDQPDARVEWRYGQLTAPVYANTQVPAGAVEDGRSYAFAVKSSDGHAESPWSTECTFTVDDTSPSARPGIFSDDFQDFPAKGYVGIPGTFTFSANGVADVVGFYWGENSPTQFVSADRLGGTATVTWTPTHEGPNTIVVRSADRAHNSSDYAYYTFRVLPSAPSVEDTNPDAWPGDARSLRVTAGLPDTVSYTYSLDEGAEHSVAAAADGTTQIGVVPNLNGSWFMIRGVTATGQVSATTRVFLAVHSAPIVTSAQFPQGGVGAPVGTEATFHFAPRMTGVTEYVYSYDQGPWQTVPPSADGTADITLRPETGGDHHLVVYSRTAEGTESQRTAYTFTPMSTAPMVDCYEYPEGIASGGPGVTGRFFLTATASDAVDFVYSIAGGEEQTVSADPFGSFFDWTPSESGNFTLVVRSRGGDGQLSDPRGYLIVVAAG